MPRESAHASLAAVPPARPYRFYISRWGVAILVSALVHGLLWWYLSQHGLPDQGTSPSTEKRIEVSLVRKPATKTAAAPAKPQPLPKAPPVPKPKPQPKPVKPFPKAAKIPAHPSQRPKPKPEKHSEPPLQEFKDEFASLSHSFSDSRADATSAAASGRAGSGGVGLMPGAILNINPRIKYPREAMQRRLEGMVVVLIHIGTDGSCTGVDLLRSSGYPELDDEVLGAVQHWRFKPPTLGGMAVEGTYKHTVIFGVDRAYTDDFEKHWREIRVMPSR